MRRSTRSGKAILLAIVALLVVAGGVVGLGLAGIVPIPGLTPAKARKAPDLYAVDAEEKPPAPPPPAPTEPKEKASPRRSTPSEPAPSESAPETKVDPRKGARRVAQLWNRMETSALLPLVADWPDEELARVVAQMEGEQAAALLSALPPERASKLSRLIREEASR